MYEVEYEPDDNFADTIAKTVLMKMIATTLILPLTKTSSVSGDHWWWPLQCIDDNYNYDDSRVKPIYLKKLIFEYNSIRIFIRTILNTNIYSDIHLCHILYTNILGHSLVEIFWYKYIRIFLGVKMFMNVTLWYNTQVYLVQL